MKTIESVRTEGFLIESRALPPFMKNGFVLVCRQTLECAFIDPGDEAQQLIQWTLEGGYRPVRVLLTHAHIDHISGLAEVKKRWDIPIHLHHEDEDLYRTAAQQALMLGLAVPETPPLDRALVAGEPIRVGQLSLDIIHTPGHSPGGVCLILEQIVFCGDAVFAGSIGRTDLPGGDHQTLLHSIRNGILTLGDEKVLLPGHGPATTVERERLTNPFLIA